MTRLEKYRSSLYTATEVLHKTEHVLVEKAVSSLDGAEYVRKTYPADKREIFSLLAQLDNSHIPKIVDIFFEADTIVIEEYIPGKTLAQLLEEHHSFTGKQIRVIVSGLLSALEIVHETGLVHRDIKPSNIIIKPDGEAVLIDYSIARAYTQGDDTRYLGTVGYAAPEQYGFSPSNPKTDLYSLGVTIKELIARNRAPARLRRAMSRCTEFDPGRRFDSAKQVMEYLKRGRYWGLAMVAAVLLLICLVACVIFRGTEPETQVMNEDEAALTEQITEEPTEELTEEVTEEPTEETTEERELSEHERRLKKLDDAGVPEHLRFDYQPYPTVTLSGYMKDSMTFVPDEKIAIRGYFEKGKWDIFEEIYVSARYDLQKGIRYTLKGELRYYELQNVEILYDENDSYIAANTPQQ